MKHKTVAVDIAKNIFEIAVSDKPGQVSQQKRLPRSRFLHFFATLEPAIVLLEACGSAHFWDRGIRKFGYTVILLPPHLVRPYHRCNKHDRADTKAILEAQRNEEIQPVPIKTVEQQTLASLHRLRSGWLDTRTARINMVLGLLRELGFFIPKCAHHAVPRVHGLVEDAESELPVALRPYLYETCTEISDLEARMKDAENQLEALAKQNPAVKRLLTIPGIGLLTATALVGFIGDLKRFRSGRHFASYLGHSSPKNVPVDTSVASDVSPNGEINISVCCLLTELARSSTPLNARNNRTDYAPGL